jgi:hypothetical protein
MLFAVPDATICGPVIGTPGAVPGCDPTKFSTSYNDQFYGNTMGVAPDGSVQPNGVDFWWDAYLTNTGNCWYGNTAAPGMQITGSPTNLPDCAGGTNPGSSMGIGDVGNELELTTCFAAEVNGYNYDPSKCGWFATPPRPAH